MCVPKLATQMMNKMNAASALLGIGPPKVRCGLD